MKTKEITVLQMRQLVSLVDCIDEVLNAERNSLKQLKYEEAIKQLKDDIFIELNIVNINSFTQLGFEKDDMIIPFILLEDGIEIEKVNLSINGQIVSYDYCKKQLNDLSIEEQKEFLENFYLEPLEKFISDKLGVSVKFDKMVYVGSEGPVLRLSSNELKEHCGILSSQYRTIKLATFGVISFYVSAETGLQQLYIPSIHYIFEYTDGGSNGHSAFKASYDIRTNTWTIKGI